MSPSESLLFLACEPQVSTLSTSQGWRLPAFPTPRGTHSRQPESLPLPRPTVYTQAGTSYSPLLPEYFSSRLAKRKAWHLRLSDYSWHRGRKTTWGGNSLIKARGLPAQNHAISCVTWDIWSSSLKASFLCNVGLRSCSDF